MADKKSEGHAMRAAVIGGGTAGIMAAAQISRFFPSFDLFHIYDTRIPSIGVGEGTLPGFRTWLEGITGVGFAEIEKKCLATKKYGVRFENWGRVNHHFRHDFNAGAYAYHLSAARLPSLLQQNIQATRLDENVIDTRSNGKRVLIIFESGSSLEVDFAFDARGFPKSLDDSHQILSEIPTNAALIRRGPVSDYQDATRAVARPNGWIFVIPLTTHTSYGYIYNKNISSKAAVQSDFDLFEREDQIKTSDEERSLHFPSFMQRIFFDGALFKIGNAASFMEPLEATAIGIILFQLRLASLWLADGFIGIDGQAKWETGFLENINRDLARIVRAVSLFVAWHYSNGSSYDSPFWKHAKISFAHAINEMKGSALWDDFSRYVKAGSQLSEDHLSQIRDPDIYEKRIQPALKLGEKFGGFSELNFSQVGHGLGIFTKFKG